MTPTPRRRPPPRLVAAAGLAALLVPLALPLLRPGWLQTHEGLAYPMRLLEVERCWRDRFWSARWFPDFNEGQGYPFLAFYAPLLFYTAGAARAAGASYALALKLPVLLGAGAGVAGVYRLARLATGRGGALLAAALWLYAPYTVRNVFIRGDLAESLAAGFLPGGALAVLRLAQRTGPRHVLLAAATGALPILAHNITGLFGGALLAGAAAVAVAAAENRARTARAAAAAGVGTLLLSAFFWAPALYERRWVRTEAMIEGIYAVERNFLSAGDLFARPAVPGVGQDLPMSFELGYPVLAALALLPWALRRAPRPARPALGLAAAAAAVGIAMATPLGAPLYDAAPLLRYVQFPWRFLGPASLGLAVLGGFAAGSLMERLRPRARAAAAVAAAALTVAAVAPLLGPKRNVPLPPWSVDPEHLSRVRQTTTAVGEYLPIWVEERLPVRGFRGGVRLLGEGRLVAAARRTGRYDFTVEAGEPLRAILRDVYYPGWEARTERGFDLDLGPEPRTGRIQIAIPAGRHAVRVRLRATPFRRAAQGVSAAALLAALALLGAAPRHRPR